MTKYTFGEFVSKAGNTFPTLPGAEVAAILEKALGIPVGGIGTQGDKVLIFAPKPPKSAGAVKDAKASKGAASKGSVMAPEAKAILEKARPLTTAKRMTFLAAMLDGEESESPMHGWVESAKMALAAEAALMGLADKMARAEAVLAKPDGAAARLGKKLAKAG